MKGRIKWFNQAKGYGFIQGNDDNDYFVHESQTKVKLQTNDKVSFTREETEKGLQAYEVELE